MNILDAARSYYGLSDADVRKTEIYTNESGQPMLVFEVAFTAEDYLGIANRMKAMREEPKMSIRYVPESEIEEADKHLFGDGVKGRKVAHIDAPETEGPTTMDAVWLPSWDVPDHMRQFASDEKYVPNDDGGPVAGVRWFLMQSAMLTEEQRQKAKEAKP